MLCEEIKNHLSVEYPEEANSRNGYYSTDVGNASRAHPGFTGPTGSARPVSDGAICPVLNTTLSILNELKLWIVV